MYSKVNEELSVSIENNNTLTGYQKFFYMLSNSIAIQNLRRYIPSN